MVKIQTGKTARVVQGDILRNVQHIESVIEDSGNIEISSIEFPLVIVITQDCDLAQDYKFRWSKTKPAGQDKFLMSVLVAPLYNVEHVYTGEHLDQLGWSMSPIKKNKTQGTNLRNNETPRYHYLDFAASVPIPPSVIDFKHYFCKNVPYLKIKKRDGDFVGRVSSLYREDISHRFSSFLARIGLP